MSKKELKIIQFHPAHMDLMELRRHEIANVCYDSNNENKSKFEALAEMGVAGTVVYDNKILCVIGTFDMWSGVCEVWMLPSVAIEQHKLVFGRLVKQQLNSLLEVGHYHRIQITALNDDFHNKFLNWLGFTNETPYGMKYFTKDKSFYNMWARTK